MPIAANLRRAYRTAVLPILRTAATPCFRYTVKAAAKVGLLAKPAAFPAHGREHITIVHLSSHVGDTVMLLPMIDALRAAHPAAFIECVVQSPVGSFLRLSPSLNRVQEFEVDHEQGLNPLLELQRTVKILVAFWKSMRSVRPTTCIIPRWGCGFRDLMLAYLLQAEVRVGFASNDFDQSQPPAAYRDALLTHQVRGAQGLTEPARFLFLLSRSGLIPAEDFAGAVAQPVPSMLSIASSVDWPTLAARVEVDLGARIAIVAPGASAPRRVWPIERWAVVIQDLQELDFTVVVLAGPQDAAVARQLYDLIPADRLDRTRLIAGKTNLAESACLISHSLLFVGNDSGPGHIAGALGIPCVILFIAAEGSDPDGPSAPERIRPMGQRVVCCRPHETVPPCSGFCTADSAHCILQVQSADVQTAVRSLVTGERTNQ